MSLLDILVEGHKNPQERLGLINTLSTGGLGSMDLGASQSPVGGSPSHWESVASRMAQNRYGYTPQEFSQLDSIISRESNWDPNALNEGSGAYGIPQILPSAHPNTNLQDNPRGQIQWLLNYIQERYGGIGNALEHKDETGWY